jgi:hypothetical protein
MLSGRKVNKTHSLMYGWPFLVVSHGFFPACGSCVYLGNKKDAHPHQLMQACPPPPLPLDT